MYAVIKSGGKQYKVATGELLKIELVEAEVGNSVAFDRVLMIADGDKITVGTPFIEGGQVDAKVVAHGRAKKIKIIKFRRRKHSRTQMGHRQAYTQVEITNIVGGA